MKLLKQIGVMLCFAAATAAAQAMTLAEAQAQIGAVLDNPAKMTGLVAELPAADKPVFVGRVFKAISDLPDTTEEKAALFAAVGKAAARGAAKSGLAEVVAEIFATADIEALAVINERFAAELFSRQNAAGAQIDDAKMKAIATGLMQKVQARTAGLDDAGVRDTFAVLMLLRASGGTPANLRDELTAKLAEDVRDDAREVWIPQALGEGVVKSYAQMLTAGEAGNPDIVVKDVVPGSLLLSAPIGLLPVQLADLAVGLNANGGPAAPFAEAVDLASNTHALPESLTSGVNRRPKTLDKNSPSYPGYGRGEGYAGQLTR